MSPLEPARVGLVIPALDEEASLPLVLAELPAGRVDVIVVVDNGSSDGTARVAREGGARVVREERRGYGQACLTGLSTLFGERGVESGDAPFPPLAEGDLVVFLDGDHSDYPADLEDVLAPLERGEADFVIGSRILGGADMEALLPQAWFGNRLACFLMRVLFGARHTDLGPFRALRVGALRHLGMGDRDYGWTIEMQLKARVAGLRVVEVPVRYRPRIGTSKVTGTLRGTLGASWKILGWILGWRLKLWLSPRSRIPTYRGSSRGGPR